MKLTAHERIQFQKQVEQWQRMDGVESMKAYVQHGHTSTYEHCLAVAYYSFWLSRRLPMRAHYRRLIRAALLHDYYLYDWHEPGHKGHGFNHPAIAADNAAKRLGLPPCEQAIIRTHMFPLTLTKVPRSREAVILSCVDKACGLAETFGARYKQIYK